MDTHQQKISHLKALYHLACADNELSTLEMTYINKVAEHLGVNPDEIKHFSGSEPELELPDKEYKLFSVFHRLAIIIMIDNSVSEAEKKYCFNLGVKMGLHPNAVSEIIDHVIAKGAINALPSEIMAIFRKYMS